MYCVSAGLGAAKASRWVHCVVAFPLQYVRRGRLGPRGAPSGNLPLVPFRTHLFPLGSAGDLSLLLPGTDVFFLDEG